MNIELTRLRHSKYGIDGVLKIAGKYVADTVEHPSKYLPPGTYPITLERMIIKKGNGPFKNTSGEICIGKHVCTGCVIKSKETFDPIYFRIQKSLKRGSSVFLTIT